MKAAEKPVRQILVVDDEPTVCKAFKLLLNYEGHEVHSVDNGQAALAALDERTFDVVITDFSMPGIRGDELAARIKKRQPLQPVIMASAFAGDFEHLGQSSGQVDALLVKPFSREALREAIERALIRNKPATDNDPPHLVNQPAPESPDPNRGK